MLTLSCHYQILHEITSALTTKTPSVKVIAHTNLYHQSSMDVFGQGRNKSIGPRGPRGFPGRQGSINDFCTWFPNTILKQLQDHEEACYILDTQKPEQDIIREKGKIIEWKSRNPRKWNLIGIHPSSNLVQPTPKLRFAIDFNKNLYFSINWIIIELFEGYGYCCITFKTDSDMEQVLITNFEKEFDPAKRLHEISVTSDVINVYGYSNGKLTAHPIQHNCKNWTTLFIDYTHHGNHHLPTEYTYIIDNDARMQGTFSFQRPIMAKSGGYVGGRKDGTKPFSGLIAGMETYFTHSPKPIPVSLKKLIINSQMM